MSRKILASLKRVVTMVTVVATILWSVGFSVLVPRAAFAAITATGPFDLIPSGGMQVPASSYDMSVLRFALNASDSETLSSVAVTVANNTSGAVTNNALADHIDALKVWKDSNGNNYFDPQSDSLAGTLSVVKVTTSTSVITTGSNNTIAATGQPATSFFVTVRTDSGWASPDSILINMAADGIVTSAASPTVTALTGTKAISAMGSGGWGGFSVASVTYVNATTVDVTFTDFLDLNTGAASSTGNYTLTTANGGDNSTISMVNVLPDNKSVRISAPLAQIVSTGTDTITVSDNIRNTMGMANANTSATVIYSGVKPLVVSEIQAGTALDPFDEFVEIYNRTGGVVPTSSLKLHIINAAGASDTNVTLTWQNNGNGIPANGFILIAPAYATVAAVADAVYTTSTALSVVPNGALYISNSAASSTAVLDKVCWGSHSVTTDCEGGAASTLANDGQSIERKALNESTAATMAVGGAHAAQGNGIDTQNNSYDFVTRAVPLAQRTASTAETPTLGSWGAGNQAPNIMAAPIFTASGSSTLNIVARISDDGGPLPAANTQLIFCTDNLNTCTPNSSTPIYGISIGAGWYKFTPTTTPWNNNRSYFKYYLQAADSATPAKTKVFTSDPSFDSVTYDTTGTGIQTAALQAAKAFSVNVSQGNLGTATITGTVNDSSGAGVGSATVWIDGTQFAATTGNDGTFSFSNVGPSGGIQVKVAKEGYVDQSVSTFLPSTGLVSLGTLVLYSGNMGQGGDYNMPRVVSSFPMPGMMGFPTQSPSGGAPTMDVTFSKAMDSTTITNSDATAAASTIYLTEAGSNTKIAGSVSAPSTTQARFTPAAVLTAGRGYTLFITPAVKDTVGNPVSGNGPGGAYVLMFSTASGMFSAPGEITGFGTGNSFPPYVVGSQPAPGKSNVALNSKTFVTFSEALQNTAANLANVKLYRVTNANTASETKTEASAVNSVDSSNKILIVTPASNLTASSSYRVDVLGGLTSSKGITMGNPGTAGYATSIMYKSDFQTGSGTDSTAPTVAGTIPAAAATGVSTIKPIVINFSEAMNPSTITENSVALKLGSTSVAGNLTYDSNSRTATFVPNYALTATSTYTINVTTDVQDLAGQALSTALLRTFTTGSADTTSPSVVSAQASDFSMKVVYSQPMLSVSASDGNYASSVLNPARYMVRIVSSAGATTESHGLPSSVTVSYDAASRSVNLSGFTPSYFTNTVTPGTTLLNIVVSSTVKDIGFNTLATGANAATTTAQSSAKTGGFSGGMGMGPMMGSDGNIMQGGMMGGPPPMVGTFRESGIGFAPGVKVYPFNRMAGVSTIYGVEVPISYQVPNAGFVDITFPEGTDVSSAKKDPYSPPNNDLNGPGPGVVVFGTTEGTLPNGFTTGGQSADGVIVNATTRVVRVILGAVATRRGTANLTTGDGDQHDFLRLDIAQVVNSTISTAIDGAGNTATVETKKSDGTSLESLSSTSFFTSAAGSFTLRGHATTTAVGINGINIFLMSPMSGPMASTSAANRYGSTNGEFMFQNLVAGTYMLGADQFAKSGGTSYVAGFPKSVTVSATTCPSNICTADVLLTDASSGATVTLDISGVFSNDAIDIFAGGPGAFRKATSTLNGTLANNTDNTIKLNANGVWMVGFGPQMSNEMFGKGGPAAPTTWMMPRPKEVVISGCPAACTASPSTLIFSASAANKTIKFTVRDASSNAIANAHVSAYSPGGGTGNDTSANSDGTGSITLSYGSYKIGADVAGMPGGAERSIAIKSVSGTDKVFVDGSTSGITLSSMTNSDLILKISKPSYTISGKVTDGTNAVASSPVNAYRTDGPGNANAFTNSSGDYTLYVSAGTWKVQAFTPDYGKLPEKTITITSSNSTGQNFEPNTTSVNYATLTTSVANDANADGTLNGGEGTSNVQVIVEGTIGDLNNDGDTTDSGENAAYINTALTDTNGSSTLKLPPGTYTMRTWSPSQGEMSSSTQAVVVNSAGTMTTTPFDVLAPATGTVTLNILDSNGLATSTSQAVVEFMQIGGKTDKVESFSDVASSTVTLPKYNIGTDAVAYQAATTTNPANFYLLRVMIPGVSQASLNAYAVDGTTVMGTSSVANGAWKVEVDGNESINIRLPAINYVTGAVKDGSGTAVPDATVHLENTVTGETIDVQADTSGNYSTKVSAGTYLVQADKDGYLDTASTVTISGNGALADSATTMTVANMTISGTITAGGVAVSGATARAEKLGGGIVTATTATDGTYSLMATAGDWKVSASAESYAEKSYGSVVSVSALNISGVDIALTTTATGLAGATSQSVTPQTGGALSNSSSGAIVSAAESSLAISANAYSVSESETSNVVGGNSGTPIAGEAKTVGSYDNDGNAVTILNKNVSVGASYSNSAMASSLGTLTVTKLEQVKMASWDDTADNWQHLPTTIAYKNSSGNYIEPSASATTVAYTGQTKHFSVFNPLKGSDGLSPSAPTGITVTAGNGQAYITWTAPTTNADGSALSDLLGYELYRSTTSNGTYVQVNTSDITGATYTDTGLTNNTAYYYKVTTADTGGLESAYSSVSASVTPVSSSGSYSTGGGGSPAQPTNTAPVLGSNPITVNGAAANNTVTLRDIQLAFNVSNATQVIVSGQQSFADAAWSVYSATKNVTLSAGNGIKTLYIKFRSAYGVESEAYTLQVNLTGQATGQAPTAPSVEPTITPSAPSAPTSPAAELVVSKPESKVVMSNVAAVSFQPGAQFKFTYQYQNESSKKATVKVVRQLVNSKGKVVRSAVATRIVKAGVLLKTDVKEAVAKNLPPGEYTVKVKILNTRGKVLEENSFGITVEKLKKKTFVLGEVQSVDSPIVFDVAALAKVKSNVVVPTMLRLKYSYTNVTDKKQTVRMVRELVDENGKVKASGFGKWVMKVGEKDSMNLNQPVASNLEAGSYTLRLRALDWKTKEALAENSLNFAIELR